MEPHQQLAESPPGAGERDGLSHRLATVSRIEWVLLLTRYVLYLFVVSLQVSGIETLPPGSLLLAAAAALLQNFWAHYVFHTRRLSLFLSPVNFILYLSRTCLLVALTGGENSVLVSLFLLLLIGGHVYAPDSPNARWGSVFVCAAYAFTVLGGWAFRGVNLASMTVYGNFVTLALCGWLMAQLGRLLREMEADNEDRERAVSSSEATMRAILDHVAQPILVFGENEFVADANAPACEFFGLDRTALEGRRFREFLFDDGLLGDRMGAMRGAGRWRGEMVMVPPDGGERRVYMLIHSFIRDQRQFFVAVFQDITRQKDFEEAQRQAKERLEQANAELQRVNSLRAEFYATVARRLRSPITALLGFMDMLLEEEMGEINDDQRGALRSCRRSAQRLLGMVDEVLAAETAPEQPPSSSPPPPES